MLEHTHTFGEQRMLDACNAMQCSRVRPRVGRTLIPTDQNRSTPSAESDSTTGSAVDALD